MKMKYIIVDCDGEKVPVIFGEKLSHKGMLRGVQEALRVAVRESGSNGSWGVDPVSAGFVEGLHVDNVSGYSESMRYGHGYIDDHDLTKAHPETDLPIINGNEPTKKVAVNVPGQDLLHLIISKILRKETSAYKHMSFTKRKEEALRVAQTALGDDKAAEHLRKVMQELGYH